MEGVSTIQQATLTAELVRSLAKPSDFSGQLKSTLCCRPVRHASRLQWPVWAGDGTIAGRYAQMSIVCVLQSILSEDSGCPTEALSSGLGVPLSWRH